MIPDDITLGRGTEIERGPAKIEPTEPPRGFRPNPDPHGVIRWWKVTQTIHVSCVVSTHTGRNDHERCRSCAAPMPEIDTNAAEYVLTNHDGDRLLFPRVDAEEEPGRDSYPIQGWTKLPMGSLCPTCTEEFQQFMKRKTP